MKVLFGEGAERNKVTHAFRAAQATRRGKTQVAATAGRQESDLDHLGLLLKIHGYSIQNAKVKS